MVKYVLRVDDICPSMNWKNFNRFIGLCLRFNLRALLSVVPHNTDSFMMVEKPLKENVFWKKIKELQNRGFEIGLHGYEHNYSRKNRGILFLNNFSEFAGVPLEEQEEKIAKALNIFKRNEIKSNIFVAPGHTFDWKTVSVLKKYGVNNISDGVALYPYSKKGTFFLPVTLNGPRKAVLGVRTICLHLNSFNEKRFFQLEGFILKNKKNFCSFSEVAVQFNKRPDWFKLLNSLTFWFKGYYYLRFYLEKLYSELRDWM